MNDLDDDLSRTLHRHADNLSAAPLALDDVRGMATSIRRRRQLAAGLGVVAAVAVIVPTAMFATSGKNADGNLPATSEPSVIDTNSATPSVTPTMGSDPHALDVRDLPTGVPPAYPILGADELAAAQTGEALVRWTADGVVVETGGRTFGPYPSSFGFVRNAAATAVAWATDEGEVMAWADGETEPFVLTGTDLESLRIGAVTGTDCTRQASQCTFYVSGYDMAANGQESFTVTSAGDVGAVDPQGLLITVRDATDDGRVLGLTEVRDDGTCSAVLDPAVSGSEPLLATCKHAFDAFSPDGSYVLASDTYGDGIGSGQVAIYATVGDLMADRMSTKDSMAFYNSAVWEDETHVLLTVYQDGKWSMVRMNVDGAMEYAIAPQKGDEMEVPWRFETR